MDQSWLTPDGAGLAIGIAGGGLVLSCALFGTLSRALARRGRGHRLVAIGFSLLGALGLGALVIGAWAMAHGQPTYVWCPLLGLGAALLAMLGSGLPGIIQRYRRAQQRRALQDLAEQMVRGTSSRVLARAERPPR